MIRRGWVIIINKRYSEVLNAGYLCKGNIAVDDAEELKLNLESLEKDSTIEIYNIITGEKEDLKLKKKLEVIIREPAFDRVGDLLDDKYLTVFVKELSENEN